MDYSFPLRLYFDIDNSSLSNPSFPEVIRRINSAPFLSVHFTYLEDSALKGKNLLNSLGLISGKSLAATVPIDYLDKSLINYFAFSFLYLASDSISETKEILADISRSDSLKLGASIDMSKSDPADLHDILNSLYDAGIRYVHIPIERYVIGKGCRIHKVSSLEKLKNSVDSNSLPTDLKLQIHDPVLSRILTPDKSLASGCQGANTMLYLSPDFELYPCPLIDNSLGKITEVDLNSNTFDEKRKTSRGIITSIPSSCLHCGSKSACLGGCRGRGMIHGDKNSADPLCEYLR